MRRVLIGAVGGWIIGALSFGSIAAVAHGGWPPLEAAVIGFWILSAIGGFFFGVMDA